MYQLRSPIWNGGQRVFGIADFRIGDGLFEMEVTYTRKDGHRTFPGQYEMQGSSIRTYPTMKLKGGVTVFLVPIADWDHYPYGKPSTTTTPPVVKEQSTNQMELL